MRQHRQSPAVARSTQLSARSPRPTKLCRRSCRRPHCLPPLRALAHGLEVHRPASLPVKPFGRGVPFGGQAGCRIVPKNETSASATGSGTRLGAKWPTPGSSRTWGRRRAQRRTARRRCRTWRAGSAGPQDQDRHADRTIASGSVDWGPRTSGTPALCAAAAGRRFRTARSCPHPGTQLVVGCDEGVEDSGRIG